MTYFSSGRLSRPHSSHDASSSTRRISSSMRKSPSTIADTVTCERWLCAPYSEMAFEHGHRLVTGTCATSSNSTCSPTARAIHCIS
ncbi:Uncharacterised protein [Bordetella pertussis]|nr:Uncharacterised protein [Bordetella pertussis]